MPRYSTTYLRLPSFLYNVFLLFLTAVFFPSIDGTAVNIEKYSAVTDELEFISPIRFQSKTLIENMSDMYFSRPDEECVQDMSDSHAENVPVKVCKKSKILVKHSVSAIYKKTCICLLQGINPQRTEPMCTLTGNESIYFSTVLWRF